MIARTGAQAVTGIPDEIDRRLDVFHAYRAWRGRLPWRLLPEPFARRVFRRREVHSA